MKAVELLVESLLPPELRKPGRKYTAGEVNDILASVGKTNPEHFAQLQTAIADVGRHAAFQGGETMGLSDFEPVFDRHKLFREMDKEIALAKRESKNPEEFKERRGEIHTRFSDIAEKMTMEGGRQNNNAIVRSVASGARGKSQQAKAMISTPGVYTDSLGKLVPVFVRHSFAEGLRPAEYAASTFGARLSVSGSKTAVAKGGDFSKMCQSATSQQVITQKDCGTHNGLDLDIDDDSLKYRTLARPVAGFKAGSLIDGRVLASLRHSKEKTIFVRSPLTCMAKEGLCAHCAGAFHSDGHLPKIGTMIGSTATQAISEPIVQGSLNLKHCLLEGTLVRMADGSVRAIEDLEPGDKVLGADKHGNTFPTSVVRKFNQGLQQVFNYRFRLGSEKGDLIEINSTDCHKILAYKEDSDGLTIVPVGKYSDGAHLGLLQCWDIEVDTEDHLFSLANGLIVSNTSGMTSGKRIYSGFDTVSNIVQSPDTFADRAVVSEVPGEVEEIKEAPQGGTIIRVAGEEHYVPTGYAATVKPGQKVEAGEQLSDGVVDSRDILRLRGLGEARLHYSKRLKQALDDSGWNANRQATEILARGALDHLTVHDPDGVGDFLPDDVVSYNSLQHSYHLPGDATHEPTQTAHGKYLQENALHYTIGTKLTPKMTEHLHSRGVSRVLVSNQEPGFAADMNRLRTASHSRDDWLSKLTTSYLTSNLANSAMRGEDTETGPGKNINWAPRLAAGEQFGKEVERTGKF